VTTKEYLWQVGDARKKVYEKQSEIDQLRSMLTSISVDTENERVQSSSDPDKIGSSIAEILEREDELTQLVAGYLNIEKTISDQIDSLENARHREILHWRYVDGIALEKVAVNIMHITFRHATRIHGQALIEFENKFGKIYRKCPTMSSR